MPLWSSIPRRWSLRFSGDGRSRDIVQSFWARMLSVDEPFFHILWYVLAFALVVRRFVLLVLRLHWDRRPRLLLYYLDILCVLVFVVLLNRFFIFKFTFDFGLDWICLRLILEIVRVFMLSFQLAFPICFSSSNLPITSAVLYRYAC